MSDKLTLNMLMPNESGEVSEIDCSPEKEQRLRELGIVKGTIIKCTAKSPFGDPKAYMIRGSHMALRNSDAENIIIKNIDKTFQKSKKNILLIGNPNVGKSTVFNALTGMKQHTGNWTGKTVGSATGYFVSEHFEYSLIDLPGTYSLSPVSEEERITQYCITNTPYDAIVIVCDATNLERNLNIVLQTGRICNKCLVCINLMDEAEKRNIKIDINKLEEMLGMKTVGISATKKKTLSNLTSALDQLLLDDNYSNSFNYDIDDIVKTSEVIAKECIDTSSANKGLSNIDKFILNPLFGYPIMIILFLLLFWLTVTGANYPSEMISKALSSLGNIITEVFYHLNLPNSLISVIMDGIYDMTARVISVMLPPMAIFFPLFTILEDLGYLPRIAFNLDKPFSKCKTCGKQALTMCMGFGCNACGVTGARIIETPRERAIAIITNSFVPCNGKFPTIIALISIFLAYQNSILSALILMAFIVLGVIMTFIASKLLSSTFFKGEQSSFILELPPYRKPQFTKVFIRSLFDRTIFVLGRAIIAAAPAGLLVWLLANIEIKDICILKHLSDFLDPLAVIFGLDGIILSAFILGIAANETVIPIMLMGYLSVGTPVEFTSLIQFKELLISNGWTVTTAICTLVFALFHWPCATTLMTVKKETGSIKYTLLSAILPTLFGLALCFAIATISKILK